MGSADEAQIIFDRVCLSRGGKPLFTNFSLALTEQRIGLIGDNGSGKSSLLRLCNGLLLPDAGEVHVCGKSTARARREIPALAGFLFQNPDHQILFPTVIEELAFGLRAKGVNAKQAQVRAQATLDTEGVGHWADRPVHELSDGQKQLVCILAVTLGEPQVLLLDEPFASLDLPTRYKLMTRLAALPHQIIMASHDLELLQGFDRVIWMERGRVRADGAAEGVISGYVEAARSAQAVAAP